MSATARGLAKRFYCEVVLAYDGDECLIWPYGKAKGYGCMWHEGQGQLVSRVVCKHVNGPPPTPEHEAAHSCGKGHLGCVTKRHVSWKTRAENEADKIAHGTANRGERNGGAKLTADDVHAIRALKGTIPQTVIAKQFGIHKNHINLIMCGRAWQ